MNISDFVTRLREPLQHYGCLMERHSYLLPGIYHDL